MLIENLSINITPNGVPLVIHISQYDVGLRTFIFTPYTSSGTFTPDTAVSATLEGTKPDGNIIIHNCEYDSATGQITYTIQEQLAAVAGRVWSKIVLRDTDGNAIGYTAIVWLVDMAGVADGAVASDSDISALAEFIKEFGTINAYKSALDGAIAAVGGPNVASTVAQMTDRTKVYVYTGSQSGYTAGHWYYWNGSAWTDGGVYQATAVETDKTLAVTDMAADAKATGDAVTELKNDLDGANGIIFDELGVIRTSGTIPKGTVTKPVLSMNLSAGDPITISLTIADAIDKPLYYYLQDAAGTNLFPSTSRSIPAGQTSGSYTYTPSVDIENATLKISVPSTSSTDAVFTDISVRKDASTIKTLSTELETTKAQVQSNTQALNNINDVITDSETYTDMTGTVHDNEYMFTSGGTTQSTAWQYIEYSLSNNTDLLKVKAEAGQSARLWVLKDTSNTVVGYSADSSAVSVKEEYINLASYPTATTLYLNAKKSSVYSAEVVTINKVVDAENIVAAGQPFYDYMHGKDVLLGKILCCCGDSITYGADMDSDGITNESAIEMYQSDASGNFTRKTSNFLKTWNYQIAERHNMTLYNAGVSGSTMQGEGGINGFSLANGRYTKLPDSIDYLLIWFGWNDNAYGTLGTISDDTNASYYGGYNVVIPYLQNKYPYAKIGLIVPFGTTAGHRNAIRHLGDKWGVAVWDNYQGGTPLYYGKESNVGVLESVVTANRAKFQANGAHPNYKGHRQLADMIEGWLRGI